MKKRCNRRSLVVLVVAGATLVLFSGCGTAGGVAADLGLAGAGGVAGYHLSDHNAAGAAAGAVAGYAASRIAQTQVRQAISEAEQRGYEKAMNQAVKQQYWIIQNQQRSREGAEAPDVRLVPVVIPETTIDGVIQNARIEYLRVR